MGRFGQMVRKLTTDLRLQRREERKAKGPSRLPTLPRCQVCGTSVSKGETHCQAPSCQEMARRSAPKATIETGRQPRPPRGVNFHYPEE